VRSLVERLAPVAERLDCVEHLLHVQAMAERPTWSDRQRQVLRETGDVSEIVRRLSREARVT
jgi:carboxylate-amine ligase